MPKKLTIEEIKLNVQKRDYELISCEYVNYRWNLEVKCINGHQYKIRYDVFQHRDCFQCHCEQIANERRFTYDYVYNYLDSKGYKLLSDNYQNSSQKLKIECINGHIIYMTLHSIRDGHECKQCKDGEKSINSRFDINTVKNILDKEYDLRLISFDYKNVLSFIDVECFNGHTFKTTLHRLRKGHHCPFCFYESFKGSGNPRWNPNLTNEERENNRDILENEIWRNKVFERDNYICQICGSKGLELNAHHLDGYHWCKEKRFDLNNGITLCQERCHKEFHSLFGYKNNTKQQFEDFLLFKNNQTSIKQEAG